MHKCWLRFARAGGGHKRFVQSTSMPCTGAPAHCGWQWMPRRICYLFAFSMWMALWSVKWRLRINQFATAAQLPKEARPNLAAEAEWCGPTEINNAQLVVWAEVQCLGFGVCHYYACWYLVCRYLA